MHDQGDLSFTTGKQHFDITQDLLDFFTEERARLFGAVPLERRGDILLIAISRADDTELIEKIEKEICLTIIPFFTEYHIIIEAMERFYDPKWKEKRARKKERKREAKEFRLALEKSGGPAPIVKLFEHTLIDARLKEGTKVTWRLRSNLEFSAWYTIDGTEHEAMKIPKALTAGILLLIQQSAGFPTNNIEAIQTGIICYSRGDVDIPPINTTIDASVLVRAPNLPSLADDEAQNLDRHLKHIVYESPAAKLLDILILKSVMFFDSCRILIEKRGLDNVRILFVHEEKILLERNPPSGLFEPLFHLILRRSGQMPKQKSFAWLRRLLGEKSPEKPTFGFRTGKLDHCIFGDQYKLSFTMRSMGGRKYIEVSPPHQWRIDEMQAATEDWSEDDSVGSIYSPFCDEE
jgi:hypothetical protein